MSVEKAVHIPATSTASTTMAAPQPDHSAPLPRTLGVMGEVMTLKLVAQETDGTCTVFESHVPPGGGPPMHIHHRGPELVYVLSGEFDVFREGKQTVRATRGGSVYMPQGVAHSFTNVGSTAGRLLFTVIPGGIEHFFVQIGRPASPEEAPERPAGPPTPEQVRFMTEAAEQHDLTISGPPPGAPPH